MPRAADISWYFVHCLSASQTLAQVQPRIASLDLGMSTFLQLLAGSWAFASVGGSALAQGQPYSQLLAPDLIIAVMIWGKKKASGTCELGIHEMTRGGGQGGRCLHSMGVLAEGSRGLMCSSNAEKKWEFGQFWLLPAEIWGWEPKFNGP